MNLLPEQYVVRSRNRARSSRVAIIVICTLCAVVAVATHSRFTLNSSASELISAQARANTAIELEVDASSLKLQKDELDTFLKRYKNAEIVFPMGSLVATITNIIPESMTLEELSLDMVEIQGQSGISGQLAGFALSDQIIAEVVSTLQSNHPFSRVRMDFSRSRTIRNTQARGFRISFFIDLNQSWDSTTTVASIGGV